MSSDVIAAIWVDAPVWAFPGIRYFDASEWPVKGYRQIKRITGTTVEEQNAHARAAYVSRREAEATRRSRRSRRG